MFPSLSTSIRGGVRARVGGRAARLLSSRPHSSLTHEMGRADRRLDKVKAEVDAVIALARSTSSRRREVEGRREVKQERHDEKEEARVLLSDLRTDHAGEYGAVAIYEGALPFVKSAAAKAFVKEHIDNERQHLRYFTHLLPPAERTSLLPLWKLAGWTLGALPSLISDRALFITIDAVESFVEEHYNEQINPLKKSGKYPAIRKLLEECCEDEVHHRDDARLRHSSPSSSPPPSPLLQGIEATWRAIVGGGSKGAVTLSRWM
uniref:Ubiquinone biosynthesis protein COQ7 n=1 Tax=Palpitomonas bilix TaxID=652834 RepID=A0A7S3G368_9EUKA|mmetsp:Transcript_18370/g.46054  ORF Transcript_18370/g.46054 Transcript_18370/m.46054 type:complete len:263 (+) Transcript_18370:309-1097(+)